MIQQLLTEEMPKLPIASGLGTLTSLANVVASTHTTLGINLLEPGGGHQLAETLQTMPSLPPLPKVPGLAPLAIRST